MLRNIALGLMTDCMSASSSNRLQATRCPPAQAVGFMFSVAARLLCFVIQIVTGICLAFVYVLLR